MRVKYWIELQGYKVREGKYYHFTSEYFPFEAFSLQHIDIELTPKLIAFQEKHNIKKVKGYVYSENDENSNKLPTLLKTFKFIYED